MWLRRSKSKARVHNAPPHPSSKFGCSSFKDAPSLLFDDQPSPGGADGHRGGGGGGYGNQSPGRRPPIFHRSRSTNNLIRSLTLPSLLLNESPLMDIRIPGAEKCVVVYLTSLRVVRRTFEDCNAVQSMLQSFRVLVDERDISIDSKYMDELQRILGVSDKSKLSLPRVFIGGRYIGGAEEMRRLYENGDLIKWLDGLPAAYPGTCDACGGIRFVLCDECSGSHKCYSAKTGFRSCTLCNEYGLIRCPSCSLSSS